MKYFILAAVMLALISTPALARLGEDEDTTNFRYGDPVKKEEVANFDKKLFYHDKPYYLEITYKDGRLSL